MLKVKSVWSCLTGLFFRTYGTSLAWQCPCDHHQRFWSYKCGFFPLPITLIPGMIDCPLKIQGLSVKKFLSWCWPLSVYGFELDLFAFEDEVTFINFKITGYFTSREEHGETDSHISWSWWWCQLLCLLLFPFGHLLLGQNSSPVLPKWLYWIAALSIEVSLLCCFTAAVSPLQDIFWLHVQEMVPLSCGTLKTDRRWQCWSSPGGALWGFAGFPQTPLVWCQGQLTELLFCGMRSHTSYIGVVL